MSEQIYKWQGELAKMIEHYSGRDGTHSTAIPSLFFSRQSNAIGPNYGVYNPSLCIIVQGMKEVLLAKERFTYNPADYLVASVDLPVTAQVIEASPDVPYLAFKLEFTPSQILEVLGNAEIQADSKKNTKRAMFVSPIDSSMLDAVIRLVRLLDNPQDIPVLAPLFKQEILYRVLQGPHGGTLEQMAIEGSYTYRIRDVIEHIMHHYDQSFRIEELSDIASMSVSSLHRHFKEVTAMSPIQFQKQIRLQEARHLLLSESTDAADVSFRVGYESPSQFSREYSRLFGLPPREDIKRLREKNNQRTNA
ncbi:HTH-type transcriptional activator RhaS [Peribacillus sp. Bi96]|uniref:AraC family transcriptional regulator n=1 Tax=Peribacillus sp. Bi96 TaxID=2884273 RepID=UPI001E0378C2|nr:AraC family transcriptional regulator [Peribacillus sp. Bi96]CAH0144651.1 HTH-type transcriptional activator RhaS [Peribacillus sp. Bi96]